MRTSPNCLISVFQSFVEKFSDDLRVEYENKGIVVQTLLPGYVATNMSKIRKSTWMAPSPDKYVASALAKVGVNDHTTGYFAHALMVINFFLFTLFAHRIQCDHLLF